MSKHLFDHHLIFPASLVLTCFLSEAVPAESACGNCQKQVLEAVGKMVHVMEHQTVPGVVSAIGTGRNILNIIGSAHPLICEQTSAFGG